MLQEPGTSSGSHMWVQGPKDLGCSLLLPQVISMELYHELAPIQDNSIAGGGFTRCAKTPDPILHLIKVLPPLGAGALGAKFSAHEPLGHKTWHPQSTPIFPLQFSPLALSTPRECYTLLPPRAAQLILGMFAFLPRTLGNWEEFVMSSHLSLGQILHADKCKNIK